MRDDEDFPMLSRSRIFLSIFARDFPLTLNVMLDAETTTIEHDVVEKLLLKILRLFLNSFYCFVCCRHCWIFFLSLRYVESFKFFNIIEMQMLLSVEFLLSVLK